MRKINKIFLGILTVMLAAAAIGVFLVYNIHMGLTILAISVLVGLYSKLASMSLQLEDMKNPVVAVQMPQMQPEPQLKKEPMAYVTSMPEPVPELEPEIPTPEQIVEEVQKEVAEEEKAEQKPVPVPEPKPEPKKPATFKCRKCGKPFPEEKKLKRHIGMAHYQDLEI